jgi:anti-anti-sigma factor
MQMNIANEGDAVIITLTGIIKKEDSKEIAEAILTTAKSKPPKIAIDCSQLVALAYDGTPNILSALERARMGKNKVCFFGVSDMVKKSLQGGGIERVASICD